jgi:group I intron endonuclease
VTTNRQCIYAIVNIITFDSYIGSSKNYPQRWAGHRRSLKREVHLNGRLQKAWSKHGEGAFIFNVLERVVGDAEYLREREQHYLDTLHPTYNIRKKTSGRWDTTEIAAHFASKRGITRPPEVRAKIAAANRFNAAERKRLGIPHPKPTKGKIWTAEERANSSRASKGKNLGRVVSQSSRDAISVAHKARWAAMSDEDRASLLLKMQDARQPITEEMLAQMSERTKKAWAEAAALGLRLDGTPLRPLKPPKRQLKHPDATCTECGNEFKPKPGRRFTCGEECRRLREARRRKEGSYSEERICVECETKFVVMNKAKDTETCSKKCAALRWRRSEREERTVAGNLMCRKNLHVIDASDVRCLECQRIRKNEQYHISVADVPRRSWSHDGPRSAKRKIAN